MSDALRSVRPHASATVSLQAKLPPLGYLVGSASRYQSEYGTVSNFSSVPVSYHSSPLQL